MVANRGPLALAGVAGVLVTAPGPSVEFTVSRALTSGRRTALLNVAGNALGLVFQVMAWAFAGLRLAGAAHRARPGAQTIRYPALAKTVAGQGRPLGPLRVLLPGVLAGR
ncbi:MAG: hypothetical protein M0027_12990 [Candidatus Dormibacteraeota bacterium]|nr:hypothetical protein [Candidatus Dormibacteraeota bacterium]